MSIEITQYQNANQSFEDSIDNFIVRHKELNKVIDEIRKSDPITSFQHVVFVGRRGSGKSTLLRRIQAEINIDAQLNSRFIAVNLGEEQSGIYKLYDLWDYIIRELNSNGYEIKSLDFKTYKDDLKEYTKALHQLIINKIRIENKEIVLLLDNIDRILDSRSGNDESALLREFLINFNDIKIIGGSTFMSEHFWKYDMPFYQFFKIRNLEALHLDEVKQLLIHWSEKKNLPEIKEIIYKHPGKIQSIRMLTDGMPRTMSVFVEMLLNRHALNGYQYLQTIVDKATPVYQERLGTLSPAQRKVLSELAFIWDAASVEDLTAVCNMEGKTISALLHQLTEIKYVEKIKSNNKNNYYRLEERFFNLWFNMTQGNPRHRSNAKALADFLEMWYDPSELNLLCNDVATYIKAGTSSKDYAQSMATALLHSKKINHKSKQNLYINLHKSGILEEDKLGDASQYFGNLNEKVDQAFESGNYEKAIELLHISDMEPAIGFYKLGLSYDRLEKLNEAENYYLKAIKKDNVDALNNLGILCSKQGRKVEAEEYFLQAIEKEHVKSLFNLAFIYDEANRKKEAEKYYLQAIEKGHVKALNNLANLYSDEGKTKEAEKYYLKAIEKGDVKALYNLANLYSDEGKTKEAEKYYLKAIEKGHVKALNNLANLYSDEGKTKEAEKYYLQAIEKGDVDAIYNYVFLLYSQNRKKDALLFIDKVSKENIAEFILKHNEFAALLFLYLGKMDEFDQIADEYVDGNRVASNGFLISLLIHKQYQWVVKYFANQPNETETKKPIYYALLHLLDHKQDLLKMPPEIQENVNDILQRIKDKQQLYYPTITKAK